MISNNSHFKQIEQKLQKRLSDHIFNRGFQVVPQRSAISFFHNPGVQGPKLEVIWKNQSRLLSPENGLIKLQKKLFFRKFDLEHVVILVRKQSHRLGKVFLTIHASLREKIIKSKFRPNSQGKPQIMCHKISFLTVLILSFEIR